MKYRTKVFVLMIGITFLSVAVSIVFTYSWFRNLLFQEIQSRVLSIAVTAAISIDVDLHERIRTREDEKTPAYQAILNTLRSIRDANRREDSYVRYIYTMRPAKGQKDIFEFVVDTDEIDTSHVGEIWQGDLGVTYSLKEPEVDEDFTRDKWGEWLTATAPLYDKSKKPVGIVGVDIAASRVRKKLNTILILSLIGLALAVFVALLVAGWLARKVSMPLIVLRKGISEIGAGNLKIHLELETKDEFGQVGMAINEMIRGLREKEALRSGLSTYLSDEIVESVLDSNGRLDIGGKRRHITVMFLDIRGFTKLSEGMRPEKVVKLLNSYFERLLEVVHEHNGILNKFLGDGMLVLFGALKDDSYQEEHAVSAALEMRKLVHEFGDQREREGEHRISIGVGINSGVAVVGNIGSSRRAEYTAIGDTVNLASRLETATKDLGVDIVISDHTHSAVQALFATEFLGEITVKGREGSIKAYTVKDYKESSREAWTTAKPGG